MFFVTGGYHRYFSHATYKTSRFVQFLIAYFAESSVQKGVLHWAANHRVHHKYSDTPKDPHSKKIYGFYYSHVGWIMGPDYKETKFNLIKDSIKKINFSQTALAYSISNTANKGGALGWVAESILSEKIYKELRILKNGEHTKPILVPGGFLILQLVDFREVVKEFNIDEEVKKIIKEKTNQQLNRFSNIYFNKVKKDIIVNEL